MYRIDVTCQGPHERRPHAPRLAADVDVMGHEGGAQGFMIDTGADRTAVTMTAIQLPHRLMQKGGHERTMGVGGVWPGRRFVDAAHIVVPAKDPDSQDVLIRLPLPGLSVLSPYADFRDPQSPIEVLRLATDDRRLRGSRATVRPCPDFVPLLGRDVFYAAQATLQYNPRGESVILVPEAAVASAPLVQPRSGAGP